MDKKVEFYQKVKESFCDGDWCEVYQSDELNLHVDSSMKGYNYIEDGGGGYLAVDGERLVLDKK